MDVKFGNTKFQVNSFIHFQDMEIVQGVFNCATLFYNQLFPKNVLVNPNQSDMPADSKGVACWYFNTN